MHDGCKYRINTMLVKHLSEGLKGSILVDSYCCGFSQERGDDMERDRNCLTLINRSP
jgi:hypothetical protein